MQFALFFMNILQSVERCSIRFFYITASISKDNMSLLYDAIRILYGITVVGHLSWEASWRGAWRRFPKRWLLGLGLLFVDF